MRHFDLCVIGTGSGNAIVDDRFVDQSVAIIEPGPFGGTCLNVGCIPSKMYVYAAMLARAPEHAAKLGVDLTLDRVRWPDIRDRIFGRIDGNARDGRSFREQSDNITVFSRRCRFVGPRRIAVGTEVITADHIVVAAGSRPVIPDIPGLTSVPFHTSDTVMRLA
ncbi:MAG TPA: FAD-dependent oxidoreductase, partial [Propionibacteriaceae bacterium]|nr:FAD-dependent oxidoreductase [Propionibacteriaceae bacterium]